MQMKIINVHAEGDPESLPNERLYAYIMNWGHFMVVETSCLRLINGSCNSDEDNLIGIWDMYRQRVSL